MIPAIMQMQTYALDSMVSGMAQVISRAINIFSDMGAKVSRRKH
jgi:hypothetical protein